MKTETVKTRDKRGSDLFLIQPEQFHLIRFPDIDEAGNKLNKRDNFLHIPEFANRIKSHGKIEVAVTGYKKDGFYNITDGECRCRAVMLLKEKGVEIELPYIGEPRGTTTTDRLYKQIILNNGGKQFSPVEEANVIEELMNQGATDKEIRENLSYSNVYLCNLKKLAKAPKEIKDMITGDIIKSTLSMQIFREYKDFDSAMVVIQCAKETAEAEAKVTGKAVKITAKHLQKTRGIKNSFSDLKKIFKQGEKKGWIPRQDNIDKYNFAMGICKGEVSKEVLMAELFEPVIETKSEKKKGKKQSKMDI